MQDQPAGENRDAVSGADMKAPVFPEQRTRRIYADSKPAHQERSTETEEKIQDPRTSGLSAKERRMCPGIYIYAQKA